MTKTWRGWVHFYNSNGKLVAKSNEFGFDVAPGPMEADRATATLRSAWKDARMEMNPVDSEGLPEGLALEVKYKVEPA